MPITSHQVGSMIGGQQAMFGNFASYSRQISPGNSATPTYANPMQGADNNFAAPPSPIGADYQSNMGARAVSAMGNIGLPAMGAAAMAGGMLLPGMAGRVAGGLDPFQAGLGGFARGAGLRAGGAGIMSNMGRIASGGLGSVARAGIAGIGGAAASAMPLIAAGQAIQYGVGQMTEGAQFQNQVQGYLQNQFRHVNPASRSGFGFSREQGSQVSDMLRTMGHEDMMSSPQEMLRVMKQGNQMGLFRAVQDVKEFKTRFKQTVDALKEVAKTMNTTLEGAMPFFQGARQQGFWTPADVQRSAQISRTTAQTTGMSVAQTQQMMAQGAQMSRQIGAQGYTGALGMAKSLQFVGGGLRSGMFNEQELAEATGGLTGPRAVQAMGGQLQASTTRFASSRRGRWVLAAMANKDFSGFDPGRMQMMSSGMMGLGDISRMARGNIAKGGAANFVLNEQNLRGQLAKQGPEAQLGFIRTIAGKHLFGEDAKSKLVTRRLMKRYFGVGGRQADLMSRMAREAPRLMEENAARSSSVMDQEERNRERVMTQSWEGVKRKASEWWDKNVKDPLQQMGATMSKQVGSWWEQQTDKFWGRTPAHRQFRGVDKLGVQGLQRAALGDQGSFDLAFGRTGQMEAMMGGGGLSNLGTVGGGMFGSFRGMGGLHAGGVNDMLRVMGAGRSTNAQIETLRGLGVGEHAFKSRGDLDAAAQRGEVLRGAVSDESAAGRYRGMGVGDVRQAVAGVGAAVRGLGGLTTEGATQGLGFQDRDSAQAAMKKAQTEMASNSFLQGSLSIKRWMGDQASTLAVGKRMVDEIRAGRMGGEALRALVGKKGEVSERTAAFRLATAQTGDLRSSAVGLDFGKEAKELGQVNMSNFEAAAEQLSQLQDQANWELAHFTSGADRAVTYGSKNVAAIRKKGHNTLIQELMKDDSGEFKRGLALMNTGRTPEERAANKKKAYAIFSKMATSKDLSEDKRNFLASLGQEDHPDRAGMDRSLGKMGAVTQVHRRMATMETVQRRVKRMQAAMGDDQDRILDSLNAVKSAGGHGLGDRLRNIMTDTGETDPERLRAHVAAMARAGMESDGTAVAAAMKTLADLPGGEAFSTALKAGFETKLAAKALTGKSLKSNQAVQAINTLMYGIGGTQVSSQELAALRGKDSDKAEKKILGRVDEKNREQAKELLAGIKEKDMAKIMQVGIRGAQARALGGLARKPEDSILSQAARLKGGDIVGRLGSKQGMHAELSRQTKLLEQIAKSELINAPGLGNPTSTQGKADKKAKG